MQLLSKNDYRLHCNYFVDLIDYNLQIRSRIMITEYIRKNCGKIVGKSNFLEEFRKLINRYRRLGYNLDAADCMPTYQPNHC